MALYIRNPIFCRYCLRKICINPLKFLNNNSNSNRIVTLEVDSLDDFTSQLIQRKMDKWSKQEVAHKLGNESYNIAYQHSITIDPKIKDLNKVRLNSLFQEAIEVSDNNAVMYLIKQCIQFKKCPTLSHIIYTLTICAQAGDKETIREISQLCEELQPEVLLLNSNFKHFLAEAIWVRGNIQESIKLFEEIYKTNAFLRRRIRLILKYLIADVVSNRSEAALINIITFSEELIKQYKDYFPLACIWQACFLSEWFTDQRIALELLQRNEGLLRAVISRISYVVTISLQSHRTEVVYRLLEILLKYDMQLEYSGVLLSLLNYQIGQGDLRSCAEIVRWSLENDIQLPSIHHEKFLRLLLSYEKKDILVKEDLVQEKKPKLTTHFKF